MRKFHLWFGIATFVAFLLTGQYMDKYHNHLRGMDDLPRMIYRTEHIYVLLASLVHIILGVYGTVLKSRKWRVAQFLGSGFIALAPLMFLGTFFLVLPSANIDRAASRIGVYSMVLGVGLHLLTRLDGLTLGKKAP